MYRFAIYGKGGIGKSTVTTALSCAFAEMGLRVLQVGCDPKADSTLYLHGGQRIDTMLDVLRQKRDSADLADLVHVGYKDIVCAEAGGPTPGLGCAGRGIAAAFEALEARDAFDIIQPDVVLYDVLGGCGVRRLRHAHPGGLCPPGLHRHLRREHGHLRGSQYRHGGGELPGAGLRFLGRPDSEPPRCAGRACQSGNLAADIHTDIAADLPRENAISDAEVQGLPVFETAPDSDYVNAVRDLARKMLADYDKENTHDSEAQ